jgi:hypothetical protein
MDARAAPTNRPSWSLDVGPPRLFCSFALDISANASAPSIFTDARAFVVCYVYWIDILGSLWPSRVETVRKLTPFDTRHEANACQ